MSNQLKRTFINISYATFWFLVNLLTLNAYPLMHSDESWLAALTATMMNNVDLMATEPFFDLAPRAPHTLKTLYHLLQMPYLKLFGYNLTSVRLLSLCLATGAVIVLFSIFDQKSKSPLIGLFSVMLITLNSQFVYAAHFARQEMALILVLLVAYKLYTTDHMENRFKALLISTLIGFSISLHPNAFIVALMIGSLYLLDLARREIKFTTLLIYAFPMAIFACIHIIVTMTSTKNFLANYWQYASTLSVGAAPQTRSENFIGFYIKLTQRISGTYFLTDLRPLFLISLVTLLMLVLLLLLRKIDIKKTLPLWQCLVMGVGFNLALFLIGRYNPTSIVFLTVVLSIFVVHALNLLPSNNFQWLIYGVLILLTMNLTYKDYTTFAIHDYETYESFIEENTTEKDIILGNLTGGFAFSPDQFYDIRNLNYLDDLTLTDYIKERQINTIIYYEEYDYIHRNPNWQILYGDDSDYYDDLQTLIRHYGTLRRETTSPYYGNRIIRYLGDYPWSVQIIDIDVQAID